MGDDWFEERLRLAEPALDPPDALAERLWPAVRATYRRAEDLAGDSGLPDVTHVADLDEYASRTPGDHPVRGRGRNLARAVLAAAAVITVVVAVFATRPGGDAVETEPVGPPVPAEPTVDSRPFDQVCVETRALVIEATISQDHRGLETLAADLRELARRVEVGEIDADPEAIVGLRTAADGFEIAADQVLQGRISEASQTAVAATVWRRSDPIDVVYRELTPCLP